MLCGIDIGSTTCKYVLKSGDEILAQGYERHAARQAETVLEFLARIERECGFTPGRDRVFCTGSGAGIIAEQIDARLVQEVVAVAAAVEARCPQASFVSEIGGEDMKTIFFAGAGARRSKQVLMQAACSGGTGAFIEKTARKLGLPLERLATMRHAGLSLHRISSKCGIFAEADANALLKAGVPVEEIIASLFDAVVQQNLATLTRGNTPAPVVLLLGGPNLFFLGLQQAWRHHLAALWHSRGITIPAGQTPEELVRVPPDALYFGALGCIELARHQPDEAGLYRGAERLRWWIAEGRRGYKGSQACGALFRDTAEFEQFAQRYGPRARAARPAPGARRRVVVGCDFGSTTAKAVCVADGEVLATHYALSCGNPIDDAKALFAEIGKTLKDEQIVALGVTGYGKDLLQDVIGADCALVETVAHATGGLHLFPDADCICDVGGMDVKIMLLANGAVTDFRLNSQCSSGNGAFLQGVAQRFDIALDAIAERAAAARAMPQLSMGCGVFLQSDIVNQLRKGWSADEILAALCAVLPVNVWLYAAGLANLQSIGRKFILQGGTHRNLAVVKAQVDFIRARVAQAEIVVHPHCGEAGALGAALAAAQAVGAGARSRFRGFAAISALDYHAATSADTVCPWCEMHCQRSFIDVAVDEGAGRPWSKVKLDPGWLRLIVNNACPKGLLENAHEVKAVKNELDRLRDETLDTAQLVQDQAFRAPR